MTIANEFERAFKLHQQGKLREAFLRYEAVLAAQPEHASALHYSGVVLMQSGKHAAAIERIRASLNLDAGSADAWSNLAHALESETNYQGYLHGEAATVGVIVKFKLAKPELIKNEAVKTFIHDIALHAAAFKPQFLLASKIPADYLAKQKEIFEGLVAQDEKLKDKPDAVRQGAINGKLQKLLKEICFVDQPFVKDDKKTVTQMCADIGKAAGGAIELVDYRVWVKGEALA